MRCVGCPAPSPTSAWHHDQEVSKSAHCIPESIIDLGRSPQVGIHPCRTSANGLKSPVSGLLYNHCKGPQVVIHTDRNGAKCVDSAMFPAFTRFCMVKHQKPVSNRLPHLKWTHAYLLNASLGRGSLNSTAGKHRMSPNLTCQ